MKKIFLSTIFGLVIICSTVAFAAEFKFKDGTLIRGEIQGERLSIQTKFGELQPKVSDVVFISSGKIELSDGSQVLGEISSQVPVAAEAQGTEVATTVPEAATPAQRRGLVVKTNYGTFEMFFSINDVEYIDFKK